MRKVYSEAEKERFKAEALFALKRCVQSGVNPSEVLSEFAEAQMLAWVRGFGLVVSILYVGCAPWAPPLYRLICFKMGMPYVLSEIYYYWPFLIGVVSILGFGYNLVNPKTLQKIGKREDPEPDDVRLSQSGRWILKARGDDEP